MSERNLESTNEFIAKAQIGRWLYPEKVIAHAKFRNKEKQAELGNSEYFDRVEFLGERFWDDYGRNSEIINFREGVSTPVSRQLLAKQIAASCFRVLACGPPDNGEFSENRTLIKNLRIASIVATRTGWEPTYDDLHESMVHRRGEELRGNFDPDDKKTWEPQMVNMGVATNLLARQIIEDGPLPVGGAPMGENLVSLMPDPWAQHRAAA